MNKEIQELLNAIKQECKSAYSDSDLPIHEMVNTWYTHFDEIEGLIKTFEERLK